MTRPNQYNVSIGDHLIVYLREGLTKLVVINPNHESILAIDEKFRDITVSYEEVVVMKNNGNYLFGELAEAKLLGAGFGGIRVLR